jgi:hypothetical protein
MSKKTDYWGFFYMLKEGSIIYLQHFSSTTEKKNVKIERRNDEGRMISGFAC